MVAVLVVLEDVDGGNPVPPAKPEALPALTPVEPVPPAKPAALPAFTPVEPVPPAKPFALPAFTPVDPVPPAKPAALPTFTPVDPVPPAKPGATLEPVTAVVAGIVLSVGRLLPSRSVSPLRELPRL